MSVTTAEPQQLTRPAPQVLTRSVSTPRQTKGWIDWVTTTDHKKIGIMYLVTAFVFFMLGGIEALLMRVQLVRAEQHATQRPDVQPAASRCTARRWSSCS